MQEHSLIQNREVLDRTTGEVLPLTGATTDRLARFLDDSRELESILSETKALVCDELLRRMDRDARWTVWAGGYELRGQSPEAGTTYYEPDELEQALRRLRRESLITEEAAKAALAYEVSVERKPRQAGIRAASPGRRGGGGGRGLRAPQGRAAQAACERPPRARRASGPRRPSVSLAIGAPRGGPA